MSRPQVTRSVILWLADQGAQGHLAVSLGSLRLAAPTLWRSSVKLVIDCGLSETMRSFLASSRGDWVSLFPLTDLHAFPAEGAGILPMRARTLAPSLVARLQAAGELPLWESCLVCDTDTTFLQDFEVPHPPRGVDLLVMREWDSKNGVEQPLRLLRQSTFAVPLPEVHLGSLSAALGLSEDTLHDVPTYNTGVLAFTSGAAFGEAWNRQYEALRMIRDQAGRVTFSAYAAEQNALSVAIQKGTITTQPLPRHFNQFPPRPPRSWPAETTIAHFITFGRNHREARYRLWFEVRDRVRAAAWVPAALLPTLEAPNAV